MHVTDLKQLNDLDLIDFEPCQEFVTKSIITDVSIRKWGSFIWTWNDRKWIDSDDNSKKKIFIYYSLKREVKYLSILLTDFEKSTWYNENTATSIIWTEIVVGNYILLRK